MESIINQYADEINGSFSFFDRMIITGWLRPFMNFNNRANALYGLGIPLMNYKAESTRITQSIKSRIEDSAAELGRPVITHETGKSMEEEARTIMDRDEVAEGLICVIKSLETCWTAKAYGSDEGKFVLKSTKTKCNSYYAYYQDAEFGFMFVKLQSWFPYPITVYINGRELMKNRLGKAGISYTMYDNSFSTLSDIEKAQEIADKFDSKDLSRSLDHFAGAMNPFLEKVTSIYGSDSGYYWCVQQCEYATDIMFKNRKFVEDIYPSLVDHAFYDFSVTDVFSFMGRKLTSKFQGEAVSDYKKRPIGWRVKFRLENNSIKMYDKANCIRIELTINNPRAFKIYKDVHHKDGTSSKSWIPMGKSIANLYRYAEIGKECNNRFIESLCNIVPVKSTLKEIEKVCSRKKVDKKTVPAFNVWEKTTFTLFEAISNGKYTIDGFKNKDIRDIVYPHIKDEKKRASKMTREFSKLRKHGLIRRKPHSFTYFVTKKGRRIIGGLIETKRHYYPQSVAAV